MKRLNGMDALLLYSETPNNYFCFNSKFRATIRHGGTTTRLGDNLDVLRKYIKQVC